MKLIKDDENFENVTISLYQGAEMIGGWMISKAIRC